jgi:hypothetical protein
MRGQSKLPFILAAAEPLPANLVCRSPPLLLPTCLPDNQRGREWRGGRRRPRKVATPAAIAIEGVVVLLILDVGWNVGRRAGANSAGPTLLIHKQASSQRYSP